MFVCRCHVGGRGASQPQHRGGQRGGPDGQPERQRQPHGQDRSHPGQPERDCQHHGPGWGQHHGQPLRECHGQLLQQVRHLLTALCSPALCTGRGTASVFQFLLFDTGSLLKGTTSER